MAEQLFDYENTNRKGCKSKYPWDEWFSSGTTWKITEGEDFHCNIVSMHVQIRREAGKQNKAVSVFKHGENQIVIVNKQPVKNTKSKRRSK